ncbi:hypothetical protein [Pectobacterium parmentieri]|uniref:hypothetical protein n=1 Tax=Pectobacterium parmentieri TaxID=1905730 RepID=UPI00203135F5|nr:hypothetical protein [Pectobacterium parmentieri]MCL6381553.1 hypothetical protein [Pectobacterium parmentieri]
MNPSEHNKHLFCTFLSGAVTPFPNIYDAISEQILLLILKARQLNEDTEFSKWFAEQHQVLTKLRAQSDKINEIYNQNRYMLDFEETKQDSLMNALIFMRPLYTGFDEGKVSLKTWGEMNRQPSEQGLRFAEQNKLLEKFIQDDVFAILTKDPTHCPPIPPQERKGYCHQDLSIAHSCCNELLSRLDDFNKIDSLSILADAIYNLITALHHANIATPDCLSEFEKVHTNFLIGERRKNDVFHKIIKLINDEGRVEFIERIAEQCAPQYVNYLFDQFVGIYASEIIQWLTELQMYFKYAQSTPFEWQFTTITPDTNASSEDEERQPAMAWKSDYCQISIKRDTLLKLIQTNALHHAADFLADCLLSIYYQPAEQMRREKGAIPQISNRERHVYNSNSYHFYNAPQGNYQKNRDILQSFEKWHENNKALLISHKKTRTERVGVAVRLAGLKCYDLKMGIPDGNRMKIKDGVYDLVKQNTSLRFENSISDVSLQRYHSQVKKIIEKDIDALLLSQRNKNSKYPFIGAYHATKPLWSKSENPDEE